MDQAEQLGEKKISNLLLQFSIPAIVGMVVMSLYNVVDRIFVGNSAGTLGIAGITICFPIQLVVIAFVLLVSIGGNALVSIKLGEGNRDEAEHILGNSFTLLVIVGILITVLGLAFLEPLLRFFGSSNEVLPYAKAYFEIILYGTILQCLGFGFNNFIRGEGNPKIAMATMLIGAILNAILCGIFILGFHMGIRGSALATVIAQSISGIWVMYYYFSGKSLIKIRKRYLPLNRKMVSQIIALGSAQFALELATSLVNVVLNKSLIHYGGDMAISGMGIVTSVQSLILMPLFGINQGVQPIIGYNYGAKKLDRVKKALKLAIWGATFISILGFIFVEVFPHQIVSLFNKNDAQLIDFTIYAMRVFMLMLPVLGFQIVGSNYFMAVGKPKPAAILSLSRQVLIFIPVVLILPLFFKLHGVIIAGPVADIISIIITGIWLFKELKSLDKRHILMMQKEAV